MFVDRDGVLIADSVDYITRFDQIVLLPGAAAAVRALNDAGFSVVVVTDQSGVARGLVTERLLDEMHDRRRALVLLAAGRDLGLDLRRSFMVGDRASDIAAGRRAGCQTVLIERIEAPAELAECPTHVTKDLPGAVKWILSVSDAPGERRDEEAT